MRSLPMRSSRLLRRHGIFIKICIGFWLASALIILAQIGIDQFTCPSAQPVHMRRHLDFTITLFAKQASFHYLNGDMDVVNALEENMRFNTGMDAYLLDEKGRSVDGRIVPISVRNQLERARASGKVESTIYNDRVVLALSPVKAENANVLHDMRASQAPSDNDYTSMDCIYKQLPKKSQAADILNNGSVPDVLPNLKYPEKTCPYAASVSNTAATQDRWFSVIMIASRPDFARFHEHPIFLTTRLLIMLLLSAVVCFLLARYLTKPIVQLSEAARNLASGDLGVRTLPLMGSRNDELSRLAYDFDHMACRIEKLMSTQKQLFFDLSHELRSPLARLQVALELARRQPPEAAIKALDRIGREAGLMEVMIDQLLMLARLEDTGGNVDFAKIDLDRLIQDIAADADADAQAERRGVVVVEAYPVTIYGNKDLLRQAVDNVVRNAVNYTHEKTTVEIRLVRRMRGGNPQACITVRDHGSGIPENLLPNLFRPFFRVSKARERQSGGAGLGLTITEYILRLHQGTVRAINAEGGGLIVEILLPINASGSDNPVAKDSPAQNSV